MLVTVILIGDFFCTFPKKMRSIFLLLFIVSLNACNKPTGIKNLVTDADSVAINFFKGDGSMDSVHRVLIIKNKKTIEGLASQIESKQLAIQNCGYDGSLHFFKNDIVVQDVSFRMNAADCMHFIFSLKGEIYSTQLSTAAKELLQSLNK